MWHASEGREYTEDLDGKLHGRSRFRCKNNTKMESK
jgi:hypothetical protein